jgi:ribosome-binding factor A
MSKAMRWAKYALPEAAFAAASSASPKSLQLCEQARRALEFAFLHECRDEVLADLAVIAVMPDPGIRRLRVWLRGPADMDEETRCHIVERLGAARGFLRAQIAAAIHRKRTPDLAFELLRGLDAAEGAGT